MMTYDQMKLLSGKELEKLYSDTMAEIDKIRDAYRKAADREAADKLKFLDLINIAFRRRTWE